jgi:hypothetical protein
MDLEIGLRDRKGVFIREEESQMHPALAGGLALAAAAVFMTAPGRADKKRKEASMAGTLRTAACTA